MSRDEETALFTIINQTRALQGWSLASAVELEPICKVWWKELSRYQIPHECYQTLFERAFDARVNSINAGAKNIPNIDAIGLISGWVGEHGLREERNRARIAEGRYLESNAPSDCDLCFGTGWESVLGKGARFCKHGNE
jgi:hypothetical protein